MILRGDTHVGWVGGISHEWHVDDPLGFLDGSAYQSLVGSGDAAIAEGSVHATKGGVGTGKDDDSGGIHAKSVDDHFVGAVGFVAVGVKDGLGEGRVVGLVGDTEDSSGLVDDDDVLILKDDDDDDDDRLDDMML
eukprot:145005_1